jgi:hypothetical protein
VLAEPVLACCSPPRCKTCLYVPNSNTDWLSVDSTLKKPECWNECKTHVYDNSSVAMLPSLLLCTSIFVISLTCPNYWMSSLPNTAFAMPTFPPDCLVRQLTPLLWANRINYLRTNPLYRSILTPFLPEKLPDLITYRRLLEYQRRCNDTARTPILLRAC